MCLWAKVVDASEVLVTIELFLPVRDLIVAFYSHVIQPATRQMPESALMLIASKLNAMNFRYFANSKYAVRSTADGVWILHEVDLTV